MKRIWAIVPAAVCAAAWADPERIVTDTEYAMGVPEGETYRITEADVEAFGSRTLVLTGGGTLEGGAEMSDFPGDVLITNGVFAALEKGALGLGEGTVTVKENGTILNKVSEGADYPGNPANGARAFVLSGSGCNGQGAIRNAGADCFNYASKVTIEAPVTFAVEKGTLQFRYCSDMNFNGHKVTLVDAAENPSPWSYRSFGLVASGNFHNLDDVDTDLTFVLESNVNEGNEDSVIHILPGGALRMNGLGTTQKRSFVFEEQTRFRGWGKYKPEIDKAGDSGARNYIAGNVTFNAMVQNAMDLNGGIAFTGRVTGPGGIKDEKGGWWRFSHPANDFEGGVSVKGCGNANAITGGVHVAANGGLPADGVPLKLEGALVECPTNGNVDLPAVEVKNYGRIGRTPGSGTTTVKSLRKEGTGPLELAGGLKVLGATEILGGTVKFLTRPEARGLNFHWSRSGSLGQLSRTEVPQHPDMFDGGVELAGVRYAYEGWPYYFNQAWAWKDGNGNWVGGRNTYYWYTGWINVPGEGATATCNFTTSIARYCKVIIGGVTVVNWNDSKEWGEGKDVRDDWSRFRVRPPVEIPTGWQPIYVFMGNSYNDERGPRPNTTYGWTGNFAIGVDWQARCTSNHVHYAKLQDPGDGSFLRVADPADPDWKLGLDAAKYRATFAGPVTVEPGVAFELGDEAPYSPVEIGELTGVPGVGGGELKVTGEWKIRARDVSAAEPATVKAGAKLTLGEGCAWRLEGEEALAPSPAERVILRVEEGGEVAGLPDLERAEGSKWRVEWSGDGRELRLVRRTGFAVIIR